MSMHMLSSQENEYITSLESIFDEATARIRCLIIAHNDAQLVNSLFHIMEGEPAALLQIPQDTWNFRSSPFLELLDWAIRHRGIERLVLVGSSQAVVGSGRARLVPSNTANENAKSFARLHSGVKRQIAQNQVTQAHFTQLVQDLLHVPIVDYGLDQEDLRFHGLFYRAESGVFVEYLPTTNNFSPLC